jgi:hypothetical protein
MSASQPEMTTIRGLVIPAQWDDQGNITAVAISGFDDLEYRVAPGESTALLLEVLRKTVSVQARRIQTLGADLIIDVADFTLEPGLPGE